MKTSPVVIGLVLVAVLDTHGHADPFVRDGATWEIAGGIASGVLPGPALTFGVGGFVSKQTAIGGRVVLLADIAGAHARLMLGPNVEVWVRDDFTLSAYLGAAAVHAQTLHSAGTYFRVGGGFRAAWAFGGGARAVKLGLELNYLPNTEVYRDLYVDVGGVMAALTIGYQRL